MNQESIERIKRVFINARSINSGPFGRDAMSEHVLTDIENTIIHIIQQDNPAGLKGAYIPVKIIEKGDQLSIIDLFGKNQIVSNSKIEIHGEDTES